MGTGYVVLGGIASSVLYLESFYMAVWKGLQHYQMPGSLGDGTALDCICAGLRVKFLPIAFTNI